MRQTAAREAATLLRLAVLLNGKKQAVEETWRDLVGIIKAASPTTDGAPLTREELLADFKEKEKLLFLHLDDLWVGADPGAPDPPLAVRESAADATKDNASAADHEVTYG